MLPSADDGFLEPLEPLTAFAPGRVNLIGDHTDYTGGWAMPMTIELGTEVVFFPDRSASMVELSSSIEPEVARVPLAIAADPWDLGMLLPEWARFVGAVVAIVRPEWGGKGSISTTLPVGSGLSSSTSLAAAVALGLGFGGDTDGLVKACHAAEVAASGVPGGLLDQIAITQARAGHALLLDCTTFEATHVPFPERAGVLIAHCGVRRSLSGSAYAERRLQCEAAAREIGPLRYATPFDVDKVSDRLLRRRARHVVSENARVRQFATALELGDLEAAGALMNDSHCSLAIDFEVSIPELDELAARLRAIPGVFGARMTGAGFGGCVVALVERDAVRLPLRGVEAWFARPAGPAGRR